MASHNAITLIGNIGRTPEVKHTQSNVAVVNFSLATTDSWKDKTTGEWQEKTQWHRIVCWDRAAEQAAKLEKGQQVCVLGSLEYRKYTGKDGAEKEVAEIKATRVMKMGRSEASDHIITAAPVLPAKPDALDNFDIF